MIYVYIIIYISKYILTIKYYDEYDEYDELFLVMAK